MKPVVWCPGSAWEGRCNPRPPQEGLNPIKKALVPSTVMASRVCRLIFTDESLCIFRWHSHRIWAPQASLYYWKEETGQRLGFGSRPSHAREDLTDTDLPMLMSCLEGSQSSSCYFKSIINSQSNSVWRCFLANTCYFWMSNRNCVLQQNNVKSISLEVNNTPFTLNGICYLLHITV